MANWCSNLIITNDPKIVKVFTKLQKKEEKEQCGQTYKYFKDDTYLFNIYVEDEHILCETRWGPPVNTIYNLGFRFKSNIQCDYCEPGNLVYGICGYYNGETYDLFLTQDDWDLYIYDETVDQYFYENQFYGSDMEILETIFKKKFVNEIVKYNIFV